MFWCPSHNEVVVVMENLKSLSVNNSTKSIKDDFDFDHFLKKNKCEFGRYQKFLVCLLCIPGCFLSSYSGMDLVFFAYTPVHVCNVNKSYEIEEPNSSYSFTILETSECSYVVSYDNESQNGTRKEYECRKWTYDHTYFQETIVTQWNFVCNNAITVRTMLSLLGLATIPGTFSLYIQDRWGRKKAFLVTLTMFLTGNCCALLSTKPLIFAILKFIGGITSVWETSYCWSLEFVGPSKRTTVTTILSVTYGLAIMTLALLAYLCTTWVEIGICTTAPFFLLYSYAFLIPESPRWLLSQGKTDEVLKFVKTMARWENIEIDLSELKYEMTSQKSDAMLEKNQPYSEDCEETSIADYSLGNFFASSNLRWKCIVLTFICIVSNQLYFAIPYNMENLRADFYLSYVMQAAVEAPATLLNLFLLNKLGRVLPLSLSLFLSGLCCILTWPIQKWGVWGPVVMAAFARFFVCIGVAIVEQLGAELFPTVFRGISQAVSSCMVALVSVSTQYIIYSSRVWDVLPMIIMGGLTLMSAFIALLLPETKNLSLPDTVLQAELQGSVGIVSLKRNLKIL